MYAIILARGGSVGIPNKNIKKLCGKPLIAYSIEAAKSSKYISKVFVSTDDDKIKNIALEYGAVSFDRSKETATNTASSESALLELIESIGDFTDDFVFLQCTSPFTTTEDIDGTIEIFKNENADTALAVTEFHYFLWNSTGEGINHDKKIRLLRQEKEPQYLETGAVYVIKTDGFLKYKHRFFGKTSIYNMPKERTLEIDDPWDFELAEMIMRKHDKNNC